MTSDKKRKDPIRNLDIKVAQLLGLETIGEAPCQPGYCSSDNWELSYDGEGSSEFVYLAHCFCDDPIEDTPEVLDHTIHCLEVIPFYHKSDTLARQALEQICDERELLPVCRYHLNFADEIAESKNCWFVELLDKKEWLVCSGISQSLSLAICKALAKLREKQNAP